MANSIWKNMVQFRKTLFGRLYLAYLILAIATGVINGFAFVWIWQSFYGRYLQALHWETAEFLAQDLAPHTSPVFEAEKVDRMLARFRRYNPTAEPYLISATGEILARLGSRSDLVIDIEPVRKFVEHFGYITDPILGSPQQHSSPKDYLDRTFSAHPILIEEKPGYVYVSLGSDSSVDVRHALGDVDSILGAAFLVILSSIAAAIAGWMIFFHITRTLRSMSQVLAEFADGKYDMRITSIGEDELASLGGVLNSMADAIQGQIVQLTHADSARRELVASIAHDIRNPIAQIRLSLEAAKKDKLTLNREQQGFITGSLRALDSLNVLIEGLFDLSKVNADGFRLQLEPVSLSELVEELCAAFRPLAEQHEVQFELERLDKSPLLLLDAKYLSRAISNLLDNAIQYSHSGGKVFVSLSETASASVLVIRDQGVGIATEDLALLSQPFHRGKHGRKKHSGGTGLGLTIARKVVELHSGTLLIQNAPEQGAEVVVTLPHLTPLTAESDNSNETESESN